MYVSRLPKLSLFVLAFIAILDYGKIAEEQHKKAILTHRYICAYIHMYILSLKSISLSAFALLRKTKLFRYLYKRM